MRRGALVISACRTCTAILLLLRCITLTDAVASGRRPANNRVVGLQGRKTTTHAGEVCDKFVAQGARVNGDEIVQNGLLNWTHKMQIGFWGRLGNRIQAITNMIHSAEANCCDVLISDDILTGWTPDVSVFRHSAKCSGELSPEMNAGRCLSKTGSEWFYHRPATIGHCASHLLKAHFGINDTHVLGRSCPSFPHAALHVRSGDIVSGRGLHSSTLQLNLSAFCVTGGAVRGCFGGV
jgi:hypothetical protein